MENGPSVDDFPTEPSIHKGFSMAMLNNQMVLDKKWKPGAPNVSSWSEGAFEAVGDPVDDALCFERRLHRIVLVEGLYLLRQQDGYLG